MTEPVVEIATAALLRAWRRAEHTELWLRFTPRAAGDVMAEVAGAVGAANDVFDESDAAAGFAFAEGPWETAIGRPAYQAVISRTGYEQDVLRWLEAFAEHLARAGLTGTLTPAPRRDHRTLSVQADMPLPQLMTYCAHTVVDPAPPADRPYGWNVDDGVTDRIATDVQRAAFPGAETYLSGVGDTVRTEPAAAADALRRTLPRDCIARVSHIRRNPPRVVSTTFSVNGTTTRLAYEAGEAWADRLRAQIAAMTALAPDVDLAFVQYSNAIFSAWEGLDIGTPPLPGTREHHVRYNRHLLSSFVPDARGALVLTDAHLERAADLSGWSIAALGHGRHLVQAGDLSAWYAQPQPAADVLAQARADFGEMILTLAAIERNPPPAPPAAPA